MINFFFFLKKENIGQTCFPPYYPLQPPRYKLLKAKEDQVNIKSSHKELMENGMENIKGEFGYP